MAHHVYQTEAFVLRGIGVGDANKFIDLFTRELGLIRAVAKSVRRERSKLRFSLQDYTFTTVSVVRGKEVWRVTGAVESGNTYYDLRDNPDATKLLAKTWNLMRRLLHGEEKNELLFDILSSLVKEITNTEYDQDDLQLIEILTVLRILNSLGYLEDKGSIFDTVEYTKENLEAVKNNKRSYVQEINQALETSQL